jgi:hypothetical protein
MDISFERAKYIISQVRNVDFSGKSEEEMQRGWDTILHEAVSSTPSPQASLAGPLIQTKWWSTLPGQSQTAWNQFVAGRRE